MSLLNTPPEKQLYRLLIAGVLLFFGLYYLAVFLLGDQAYITILDVLDSEFNYLVVLKENHLLLDYFTRAEVPQIMEGIPRMFFRSSLNLTVGLFAILSPLKAYFVNALLVRFFAFLGMFLLLKKHFIPTAPKELITACALLFAVIPFYHLTYGLSVAGQPLLLYAFLSILKKEHRWYHWLILLAFPFYSFLVVTLPFFGPFLLIPFIGDWKKNHRPNYLYLGAIALLSLSYIVAEFPLIYSTLTSEVVSHRADWHFPAPSVRDSLKTTLMSLKTTQYHAGLMITAPILLVFLGVFFQKKGKNLFIPYLLLACLLFIALWNGFGKWPVYYLQDKISLLRVFRTERFYFLAPMLWILLLATCLHVLHSRHRTVKAAKWLVVAGMFVLTLSYDEELKNNLYRITGQEKSVNAPAYREFFSPGLFGQIERFIGKPQQEYKVVSLGLHPSVAQYNGFYTLDSYQNNYPLAFKKRFRKVIAGELEKNEVLKNYFDRWGSRAYIMVAELGKNFMIGKNSAKQAIEPTRLNTGQLKKLGAKYLFSAVRIKKPESQQLELLKVFETQHSYWRIYLYQINEPKELHSVAGNQ